MKLKPGLGTVTQYVRSRFSQRHRITP